MSWPDLATFGPLKTRAEAAHWMPKVVLISHQVIKWGISIALVICFSSLYLLPYLLWDAFSYLQVTCLSFQNVFSFVFLFKLLTQRWVWISDIHEFDSYSIRLYLARKYLDWLSDPNRWYLIKLYFKILELIILLLFFFILY